MNDLKKNRNYERPIKRSPTHIPQHIKPGKYQHYKGKQYEIIGVAHHSETLEPLVVYRALYNSPEFGDNALWVRPLAMFAENVEIEGKLIPRFTYIE